MIVLTARNVNYALPQGVTHLHRFGVREPSRNGDVLRELQPVTTVYERPVERVCLHPWRDANPFFHLIESLWMIAGRDDLATLTRYVSTFGQFSDDGVTVPGAYGKRWRNWMVWDPEHKNGYSWPDQLDWVVKRLRKDPRDRRTVISMWDPAVDPDRADRGGRDVPCNLTALPFETEGALNLTVFCRSNDMVLGAYGANAVHFSFLLEYLAARVGLKVGRYYQVSNNFHAYVENAGDPEACWPSDWNADPYASSLVEPFPIFRDFEHISAGDGLARALDDNERERMVQQDLKLFFDEGPEVANRAARWPFLRQIAAPMALAHRHWKGGKGEDRFTGALEILDQMPVVNDWRAAAVDWINRRHGRWQRAQDDGAPK